MQFMEAWIWGGVSGLKGPQQQEVGETPEHSTGSAGRLGWAGLGLLGLGAGFAQLEPPL